MNIWALRKQARLKRALLTLTSRVGGFTIRDEDGAHDQAIRLRGINDDGFSVYLYTYGQSEGRYGLQLEYPEHPGMPRTVETREELSLEQLIRLLEIHFYS